MTDTTASHTVPMYPALSQLETKFPPTRYGHEPFWRAPVCPAAEQVFIPTWNWTSVHDVPAGARLLTLDVNGAFLAAAGHVSIAHGKFTQQGPWEYLPTPGQVPVGYYQIKVPYWAFSGTIVHPLGNSAALEDQSKVWISHPTLVLLLELLDEGSLGELEILNSWTCATNTNFRAWVAQLKVVRNQCLDQLDNAHPGGRPDDCECFPCAKYGAFKEGYSAALSMMLTGEKCKTRRPDWAHAVYAEHAAASWRKAWRYTGTGRTLLSMGRVDEITILRDDLPEVLGKSKPPFRVDGSGRALGAFKPKATATPPTSDRPAALAPLDLDGDIF